jgi:hypothetical protein
VNAALRALYWVTFVRKPDWTNGDLREKIVALFGPEVDGEIARRFANGEPLWPPDGNTTPRQEEGR